MGVIVPHGRGSCQGAGFGGLWVDREWMFWYDEGVRDVDVAWFAGLFEGEGCISVRDGKRSQLIIDIKISSFDEHGSSSNEATFRIVGEGDYVATAVKVLEAARPTQGGK